MMKRHPNIEKTDPNRSMMVMARRAPCDGNVRLSLARTWRDMVGCYLMNGPGIRYLAMSVLVGSDDTH